MFTDTVSNMGFQKPDLGWGFIVGDMEYKGEKQSIMLVFS